MNTSPCISLVTPPTTDVHYNMHIGCRADCAGSLCCQLMKNMRAMRHAYSPRICAEKQKKDGHRKSPHRYATAGRGLSGGAFLASLDASHDRFLLPSAAPRLPHFHTRRAYARRLCTFGAGKRASRRAPTGFAGLHAPRRTTEGPVQNRVAILNGFGSSTCVDWAGRPTRKAGGRAPLRLLAGGALPPTIRPPLGGLESLGRFLGSGSPQRLHVPAGAGPLWRTLARLRLRPIAQIPRLSPRLSVVSPRDLATAPAPLVPRCAPQAACHLSRTRLGAKRNARL